MKRTVSSTNALATALAAASLSLAAVSIAFAWANQGLPMDAAIKDAPKWFGTQNALSAAVFAAPDVEGAAREFSILFEQGKPA